MQAYHPPKLVTPFSVVAALVIACLVVACASNVRKASSGPDYEVPGDAASSATSTAPLPTFLSDGGMDAGGRKLGCIEGSTDGGALDVWIRHEGKTIVLDAPALAVHEKWLELDTPLRCDGDPRRATPRLTTTCSAQETSFMLDLTVEDGRLIATSTTKEYGGKKAAPLMSPHVLPCGARVVFHGLVFRDPKWKRFGSPCMSVCVDKHEECAKPCVARFTGSDDELTDEGAACVGRCMEAEATCMEHCPPG